MSSSLRKYLLFAALSSFLLVVQSVRFDYNGRVCSLSRYYNRLREHIKPTHYDVYLDLSDERTPFAGSVRIKLQFLQAKSKAYVDGHLIVLHADENIEIDGISFVADGKHQPNAVVNACRDYNFDMVQVELARSVEPDSTGELRIEYSGRLRSDLLGLYSSEFKDGNHKAINILATNLEATYARSVMPCFDEPAIKATFSTSVRHQADKRVLSNQAAATVTVDRLNPRLKVSRFNKTPPMSTYLFAVVVGQFDSIGGKSFDGRYEITVHTPLGRAMDGAVALKTAKAAMETMEAYFGIGYAPDKLDLVSVPVFFTGAMENWGLCLFAETLFLTGARASARSNIEARITVLHELVHQWLGNLVTLRWWNELWLNEGFASYLSHMFADTLFPEIEAEKYFIVNSMNFAMREDVVSSRALQPLRPARSETKAQIEALFDGVTYSKGPAIVRWLVHWMTPEVFREAIRRYVSQYQYKNADVKQLGACLEEVSGLPVNKFLASWLDQIGYPLVEARYDSDGHRLILSQGQYDYEELYRRARARRWFIPGEFLVSDGENRSTTIEFNLEDEHVEVKLPSWFNVNTSGHYVKLNPGFKGYYHSDYSEDLLRLLDDPISKRKLNSIDRLEILHSKTSLAKRRSTSTSELVSLFTLLESYLNEDDVFVVSWLYSHSMGKSYQKLAADIAKRYYRSSGGFSAHGQLTLLESGSRGGLFTALVAKADPDVVSEALALFDSKLGSIPTVYQEAVYSAVVRSGTSSQYNKLVRHFTRLDSVLERDIIVKILAEDSNLKNLRRIKELISRDDFILTDKHHEIKHLNKILEVEKKSLVDSFRGLIAKTGHSVVSPTCVSCFKG